MARSRNGGSLREKRLRFFSQGWVRAVLYSFIAGVLLFASTETELLDKVVLARWICIILGIGLIIYLVLPWLLLVCIYLTLRIMVRYEDLFSRQLLKGNRDSHYLRTMFDSSYHRETFFAATAFVWSKQHPHKFLWVMNRQHKKWLPPGGRLFTNELPHEAIKVKVGSETGIPTNKLHFCSIFHGDQNAVIADDEVIEIAPIPIRVQKEINEQRGEVPFHYDFFYVIKTDYTGIPEGEQTPQWLSIEEIEKTGSDDQPFFNVLFLARQVLKKIETCSENATEGPA